MLYALFSAACGVANISLAQCRSCDIVPITLHNGTHLSYEVINNLPPDWAAYNVPSFIDPNQMREFTVHGSSSSSGNVTGTLVFYRNNLDPQFTLRMTFNSKGQLEGDPACQATSAHSCAVSKVSTEGNVIRYKIDFHE